MRMLLVSLLLTTVAVAGRAQAEDCNLSFSMTHTPTTPVAQGATVHWTIAIAFNISAYGDRIIIPAVEFDLDCFNDGNALHE